MRWILLLLERSPSLSPHVTPTRPCSLLRLVHLLADPHETTAKTTSPPALLLSLLLAVVGAAACFVDVSL